MSRARNPALNHQKFPSPRRTPYRLVDRTQPSQVAQGDPGAIRVDPNRFEIGQFVVGRLSLDAIGHPEAEAYLATEPINSNHRGTDRGIDARRRHSDLSSRRAIAAEALHRTTRPYEFIRHSRPAPSRVARQTRGWVKTISFLPSYLSRAKGFLPKSTIPRSPGNCLRVLRQHLMSEAPAVLRQTRPLNRKDPWIRASVRPPPSVDVARNKHPRSLHGDICGGRFGRRRWCSLGVVGLASHPEDGQRNVQHFFVGATASDRHASSRWHAKAMSTRKTDAMQAEAVTTNPGARRCIFIFENGRHCDGAVCDHAFTYRARADSTIAMADGKVRAL